MPHDSSNATASPSVPRPGAEACRRVVASLIADEIRFQRGEDLGAESATWDPDTDLRGAAVRGDSMELIAFAARVNQVFHLHEHRLDERLRPQPTLGTWAGLAAEALATDGSRITFLTSGSTGAPKACTHAIEALALEVAGLAAHFAGRRRVVATTPPHHIYGFLFTVMLPAALGVPVVDLRGAPATAIRRRLEPGDLVVSFPLGWEQLGGGAAAGEGTEAAGPVPNDVLGVTSTGPCSAGVIGAARETGFGPITEVYGSSETAGIGLRDDPARPYELMPHWSRVGSEGAADSGDSVADREGGRDVTLVTSGLVPRTVRPMDRLDWVDGRRFRVMARHDRVVQVGGVNVFPDQVSAILSEHPGVADAAVRLMRPDEGPRLKAFIRPVRAERAQAVEVDLTADDHARLRAELDAWCAERLDAPSRPRAMRFGDELPRGEQGKPADWDAFAESRTDAG